MNEKEIIDMFLRLEARITQLEEHHHSYTDLDDTLGSWEKIGYTSKPKVCVSVTKQQP